MGAVLVVVAKLPVLEAKLRKVKLSLTAGVKVLNWLNCSVPPRLAVPVTLMTSYPVPAVVPPSSMAVVLPAPSVRLPVMLRVPGEKPEARVPPVKLALP